MLSKSSSLYLMAISVADNFVLIFIVVLELSLKHHQWEPFWSYEPWCNLRDIFTYGAYNASTWLVVLFTVERFIAIHTRTLKTKVCTREVCSMDSAVCLSLQPSLCYSLLLVQCFSPPKQPDHMHIQPQSPAFFHPHPGLAANFARLHHPLLYHTHN